MKTTFPVVGLGASAGGLEACTKLFRELPADSGMAFVLVQHLDPNHESILPEIIARSTSLPVIHIQDGMRVEPNRLYVIPQNTALTISEGTLRLAGRRKSQAPPMTIDTFFRSLAHDQGSRAIGVILSGTASDGVLGIKAIKAEGGITFAQDEQSAKYTGMPRSAVATGCIDFVLPPPEIARELARIGKHPYVARSKMPTALTLTGGPRNELAKILQLLRLGTGIDFTHYKQTTIHRRIQRRVAVHKSRNLREYLQYLRESRDEVKVLGRELLITVTSFFRDPEAFEALKRDVFPRLTSHLAREEPLRIWVPGCSTGEEVYSLAIALLEFLGDSAERIPIQFFATDVSDDVLDKARSGTYLENIELDVSPERLRRFFVKTEAGYRINQAVRELCVFARQDLTRDPPFSRMDLISCRNVLIYMGPQLQKRILPLFHYALKPHGALFLGTSETIGAFGDLFDVVDRKYKIFAKRLVPNRPAVETFQRQRRVLEADGPEPSQPMHDPPAGESEIQKEADRLTLARYAPPGVLVDDSMEILQFRGDTSPYLAPVAGRASFSLPKMAREGLMVDLVHVIERARKRGAPVVKKGVRVKQGRRLSEVDLRVIPIVPPGPSAPRLLVLFEKAAPAEPGGRTPRPILPKSERSAHRRTTQRLERELAATKKYLQALIEEQEATNEELKAANEEVLSSNEELQSTNEELETTKEELQSANEELTTVNEEVQNRNSELGHINDDLNNLLGSVNLPIVMLGSDLRIRRFTPIAGKVLNLIPTDVGRPMSDLKTNIEIPELDKVLGQVIDSAQPFENDVRDREGRWYSVRIRPYRTQDNRIDGAVVVLVDIDLMKRLAADPGAATTQLSS